MGKANERAARRPQTIQGGSRLRKCAASPGSWTAKKERAFLGALADSCNVTIAAKVAGVSGSSIYLRRSNNAAFRRGWDHALAAGYAALELTMLERALHGVEKTVELRGGGTRVMREYSDRVGLTLLRMHRETAALAEENNQDETSEAAERIIARLARLRPTGEESEADIETKGLKSAYALIEWALLLARSTR